jgi:hypothetical protein
VYGFIPNLAIRESRLAQKIVIFKEGAPAQNKPLASENVLNRAYLNIIG